MKNPAEVLVNNGKDNSFVQSVVKRAQSQYSPFPSAGCAYFLGAFLELSGYGVGVHGLAEDLATALKQAGWKPIAIKDFQAGDVGVTLDLMGSAPGTPPNGNADHIFIVLERPNANSMLIVDNQQHSVQHLRPVRGGQGATAVDYFLRHPNADRKPITVQVRGTVVPNAEGYQLPDGTTHAWVRDVAKQLGASIVDYSNTSVTLSYNGTEYLMDAEVRNGKAFVALAKFRNIAGIQVSWNTPSMTANIF
jgi:hypothetical protein